MTRFTRYEAFKREILNLPNLITVGRLFLIPPVLWLIDPTDPWRNFFAALLFAAASGLDIVDGWLARSRGLVTVFGKFVDPLADKLMAMSVLVWLVTVDLVPAWLVVLMLGRDFYISGLRSVAANQGVVIAAGETGKLKTVFQLVGICCVLARYRYRMIGFDVWVDYHMVGMMLLYISALLSGWSAFVYTRDFIGGLKEQRADG